MHGNPNLRNCHIVLLFSRRRIWSIDNSVNKCDVRVVVGCVTADEREARQGARAMTSRLWVIASGQSSEMSWWERSSEEPL